MERRPVHLAQLLSRKACSGRRPIGHSEQFRLSVAQRPERRVRARAHRLRGRIGLDSKGHADAGARRRRPGETIGKVGIGNGSTPHVATLGGVDDLGQVGGRRIGRVVSLRAELLLEGVAARETPAEVVVVRAQVAERRRDDGVANIRTVRTHHHASYRAKATADGVHVVWW